jgi:glycosyltransferase involved in cell wall biosynthesis
MTATLDANFDETGSTTPGFYGTATTQRWPAIHMVSIVIPALNEEENIPHVLATVPRDALMRAGCAVEVVIVDNGSTDRTSEVAAALDATVVYQPERGYGNAYHAGFAAARGDVIVTGDADCTYPFDALLELIDHLECGGYDFLSTNRLGRDNRHAMKRSHAVGNSMLTAVSRSLFHGPFRDSQSGMWIFRRSIWAHLDVRSGGMQFSQEIKNEAYLKGFRCDEVPIEYRPRGGTVKLNAFQDGTLNLLQLAGHRMRGRRSSGSRVIHAGGSNTPRTIAGTGE